MPSFCLPLAAERARGAFEIGRQVGDAGLDHRIDDALRREEGKPERRVIPDRGVEARVPRGEGRAAIEGGAEIVRRVVPIENRAVGVPGVRRGVADGVSQNDRARRGVGGIAESPDRLQIDRAGDFEINPNEIAALNIGSLFKRSGEAAAVSLAL